MFNFETGNVKLLSGVTVNGSPIELSAPVELIIRNSDTGLYWDDNDAFVSSPFSHTMTHDATAQYYFYTNSNLVLQGLYEAIFSSDNTEKPFRIVEQFLIIPALFDPAAIGAAVWATIAEGALTYAELQRIMLSVLAGKATASQSPDRVIYRDLADSINRVIADHSADGDRTSVTLDGS